ncbi:hypothetical protein [Polymorphum gilvum]|uniref:Uncharacterized protein n=1 Tax=Polymorphum gilvum (strain LMG 25793 / CGMCC 1.9160 / SL003B-26A1) TaxID=991905 RepID=F2J361_POLGS|nr:hypothetical protein [Polymorphum gilvum]ADZ69868.1 hypothetical protein SL003B_1440 [Polymorphum gilvum SL003B-26A1]
MSGDVKLDEIFDQLERGIAKLDIEALARMSDPKRMLNNSLNIRNLDTGGHLLGLNIDYSGKEARINIPPGGNQTVQNFSFLTMWFIQIHVDPPVRLTNQANNVCFYEVNRLMTNGHNVQQQFINPHAGATAVYGLDVNDRLIVVPVSMTQYYLRHANHIRWQAPGEDRRMREAQ